MLSSDDSDVTAALAWAEGVIGPVAAVRELSGGWDGTGPTLVVFACSAIGRVLPLLALVQGAANCTALGVCVWLAGRSDEAVSSSVATLQTGAF